MSTTKPSKHAEARRLHALGFKLCALNTLSKEPVGKNWQIHPVAAIDDKAAGYGLPLALNGLCSIDPDNLEPAREGLNRCGFDLESLMSAGVRTTSTRPGSGGRSTFKAPAGLERVVFTSRQHGTLLELRCGNTNLQDCLPGTRYRGKDGRTYVQGYATERTFDQAPDLPADFLAWWQRLDCDLDFRREQQALFCGEDAVLSVSGKDMALAYTSGYRTAFNSSTDVVEMLERHNYVQASRGRWAPASASGAPSVRLIPGKKDLWQSDHASDPLMGTFDAWTAFVVLEHGGELARAEAAYLTTYAAAGFSDVPVLSESEPLPAFARNEKGQVLASKENLRRALSRPDVCGFHLRFDTFKGQTMIAPYGTEGWRGLRDVDYTELSLRLERLKFRNISKELMRDGVEHVAEGNQFDTAQHWLNGLHWDGKPRVEQFLATYFRAEDNDYSRAVSRYFWTAAAGRVVSPGAKADMVPVAVGAQGLRKSTAIALLVPDVGFYLAADLSMKDVDLTRLMRGKLVIELDELRGLATRDAEHLKSFISRTFEEWTPKFREQSVRYYRRSVFFGSSNRDDFLADETGNRRWLPFRCGLCDTEGLERDRDQLWAEAREMFNANGVLHRDAERLAADEHDGFTESDEWDAAVLNWLHGPDFGPTSTPAGREFLTARDVLQGALSISDAQQTRPHQQRIKKVLIRLGYTYVNKRSGGTRQRGYVPPSLF